MSDTNDETYRFFFCEQEGSTLLKLKQYGAERPCKEIRHKVLTLLSSAEGAEALQKALVTARQAEAETQRIASATTQEIVLENLTNTAP